MKYPNEDVTTSRVKQQNASEKFVKIKMELKVFQISLQKWLVKEIDSFRDRAKQLTEKHTIVDGRTKERQKRKLKFTFVAVLLVDSLRRLT